MEQLRIDADRAFNTSRSVGNEAEELRGELSGLQRDWENLSQGWTGVASSAYSKIWSDWLEGATALVEALSESSQNLGAAAAAYADQDAGSAAIVRSIPIDLGL